jgi:chromosome segregation ATPase
MEHLEDPVLHNIKAEGAKLSLQIERCLQQQIAAQTNARAPVLAGRSHVEYPSVISERDVERRQRQEEIRLLTEKLRVKEAECKSLKTQNPISGLQTDLAEARKRAERLQETVDRQNEEIISLKRNRSHEQEKAELRRRYEAVDRLQSAIDNPYESLFPATTRGAPVSSSHPPPPSYEAFSSSSMS